MDKRKLLGNGMLLLTALIWGSAFVAQRAGMDFIGPLTFHVARSFIGGLALLPVVFFRGRGERRQKTEPAKKRHLLVGGLLCGIVLCVSSCLQQYGIQYTTVGKAGFITALYVILVPLTGLFLKKRVRPVLWLCVGLAVVGLYLLCMTERLALSVGDTLVLLCAIGFTVHILVVDRFSAATDGVKLACIQFFVSGAVAFVPMFLFEKPEIGPLLDAWLPVLYAGLLSSGVGYTLQVVGQKYTDPTMASLLMSLESVFAVLTAALILRQIPTPREAVGCVVMFAAILLAQLPEKRKTV